MPDPLTAAEMAALSSITDAAGRINAHLAALRSIAASVMRVGSIPSVPNTAPIVSAAETSTNRVPLNPVPPIRASLIGEPMQQAKPLTALDLARYQVPPGGADIKPDHGG